MNFEPLAAQRTPVTIGIVGSAWRAEFFARLIDDDAEILNLRPEWGAGSYSTTR
ncbi:MAG: hypothetical protein M3069_07880 [Chloroflexota bacterium]|nr:hypothetical protein [Chloroflexota bacterium]